MADLDAAASRIAKYANECCGRSDGYEEDVQKLVAVELRAAWKAGYDEGYGDGCDATAESYERD